MYESRPSHAGPLPSIVAVSAILFTTAVSAQGLLGTQQGKGGSAAQGAAGTSGSTGDDGIQKCAKPMGAVAVVEPQDHVLRSLTSYGLQSPVGLIRLMIQQSNCFIVVERGVGMENVMQERALAESGELRQKSNMGKGQMVTADFILTPSVVFSEGNAGGVGGLVGGIIGRRNPVLGAVAGGLKFKEAQTSMLLADSRSSVQVAAAEGSARKADFKIGTIAGWGAVGGLGGYTNTNEGKVITASFVDNYNNIVTAVRGDPNLQRDVGTLAEEAGRRTAAGEVFNEGDVVVPKIANIKLHASPVDASKIVATLGRGEELVVIGAEQDGFLNVQGASGAGWIKKVLVTRP
ncbi:MAG: hypothetical protein KDI32_02600 [Pseudomonadales bacterium]|nr:hypothetical protein [Pseudomonadales bacterium]